MRSIFILSFLLLVCVSQCFAVDLIVGSIYNTTLGWQEKVQYLGIPFKKRVKNAFYSNPHQKIIKGIVARDIDRTGATAIVTAGGVGTMYSNIRFKSERGGGLNYQIEYYF